MNPQETHTVEDLNANVNKLMGVILPNPYTGRGGLVNDLKDVQDKVVANEREIHEKFTNIQESIERFTEWKNDLDHSVKLILKLATIIVVVGTLAIQILSYFKK